MFKDFYEAWWFLYNHKIYQDEYDDSYFEFCTFMNVVKVNTESNIIEDDSKLNTKTRVWLESGKYLGRSCTGSNMREHDIELDCSGDTYEEAIIELANLVKQEYGD